MQLVKNLGYSVTTQPQRKFSNERQLNYQINYAQPNFTGNRRMMIDSLNKGVYKLANMIPMLKHYWSESAKIALEKFKISEDMPLDAFRHGWTSADITHRYGKFVAKILGSMNEYANPLCNPKLTNMDLWNNRVGREIGKEAKKANKSTEDLPNLVKEALDSKKLIIDPNTDTREYKSTTFAVFKYLQKKLNLAQD